VSTNITDLSSYIQENFGANANYVEGLLERYKAEPNTVDESWRVFFGDLLGGRTPDIEGNGQRQETASKTTATAPAPARKVETAKPAAPAPTVLAPDTEPKPIFGPAK
jgi:2-oxoglutarate dehydrogenase complex dehydrogenase (E1) component-like enzyme